MVGNEQQLKASELLQILDTQRVSGHSFSLVATLEDLTKRGISVLLALACGAMLALLISSA